MEKTIIVGVDFSDCSINALEHALTIANAVSSNLRMVWVNKAKQEKSMADIFTRQATRKHNTKHCSK